MLTIIGQDPGHTEEEQLAPFVGNSGKFLDRQLQRFNVNRLDCHIGNARACRPTKKYPAKDMKRARLACLPRLAQELAYIEGGHILALGQAAFESTAGKSRLYTYAGAPMPGAIHKATKEKVAKDGHTSAATEAFDFSRFTVVGTFHPAHILRRAPHLRGNVTVHTGRAIALARGELQPWVWPEIDIWPNVSMIEALERIMRSPRYVGVDIESMGLEPMHDRIMCVGLSNIETTISCPWHSYQSEKYGRVRGLDEYDGYEAKEIEKLIRRILKSKRLVFQNGPHDILGLKHSAGVEVPLANYWFDTLPAHRVALPRQRHYLDYQALIEFHCNNWKADFGAASDQKGLAKFIEVPEDRLRIYNGQDCYMTAMLVKPLCVRLGINPETLMRVAA